MVEQEYRPAYPRILPRAPDSAYDVAAGGVARVREWLSVRLLVTRLTLHMWRSRLAGVCSRQLTVAQREVHTLALVARHACTPWYAKLIAALAVGYAFSPVQLIPNVIPVLGLLDDVVILSGGMRLALLLTPPAILAECREHASGAPGDRGTRAGRRIMLLVAAVWLVTVALSVIVSITLFRRLL